MTIKTLIKSILVVTLLFGISGAVSAEKTGQTTPGGCKINQLTHVSGVTPAGHDFNARALRWSVTPECTSLSMSVPSGNGPISPNLLTDSAGYGAFLFPIGDPGYHYYSGDYTLIASDGTGSVSSSVYVESGYPFALAYIDSFSYNPLNNTARWSVIDSGATGNAQVRLNGTPIAGSSGSTQAGINTLSLFYYATAQGQYYLIDQLEFNYPGGSGGGGSPGSATIEVMVEGERPDAGWMIEPGVYTGVGNGEASVTPDPNGSGYGIEAFPAEPGCAVTISSSDGPGSSLVISSGETKGFTLQYECRGDPTVDIKANGLNGPVTVSPGSSATLAWTSNNATSCSASGSWTGSKTVSGNQSTGNLSAGSYTYTIQCTDGDISVSDSVVINAGSVGSPPPPPTIATLSSGSYCQTVRISWGGYPSFTTADSFSVYRDGAFVGTSPGNQFWYEDQGLTVGQTYSYRVRAIKGGVYSAYSNTSSSVPSGACVSSPTVNLSASPTSGQSGMSTSLTWVPGNATSCSASASPANSQWTGSKSPAGGGASITNLTQTTTFSITCNNASGTDSDSQAVTINPPPSAPPTVAITASPSSINSGQSSTLTWTPTAGALSCTAYPASGYPTNPQWNGTKSGNGGSQTITGITSTETFRIRCFNATQWGPFSSATVTVVAAPVLPTVTLSANPTSVSSGDSSTLTWTVVNASTCSASASPSWSGWSGSKAATNGSQLISNLTETRTYTLSCTSAAGTTNAQASVTVIPVDASLSVTTNNASASWTITPGGLVGSGTSGSYIVSPSSGGTLYTISPNSIPGYSSSVSSALNGAPGGGSSVTVFPGDTVSFDITYTTTGPAFNYSLSNGGNVSVTKTSGDVIRSTTVTKSLLEGDTQSVTLSILTSLPNGVSASISNNPSNPTSSSNVTFTVESTADTGTFPITVRGESTGTSNKTTVFNLSISPASDFEVDVEVDPEGNGHVGEDIDWQCQVTGGSGVYTYSWSGIDFPSPSPTTDSVSVTYQTVGTKTATCTVLDSTTGESDTSDPGTIHISLDPDFIEF